jgi:serine/threonine-protein kinase RsbW
MTHPEMELEVPARSVYVGVVRMALGSVARQAGLDEEKVEDLRMAVSEACANLVLAGDDGDAGSLKLAWFDEGDRFIVEIAAEGTGPAPDPASSPGEDDRLGMSVALLRSLVDEYAIEPMADGGVTARLILSA